jgi:hypothetical protein
MLHNYLPTVLVKYKFLRKSRSVRLSHKNLTIASRSLIRRWLNLDDRQNVMPFVSVVVVGL